MAKNILKTILKLIIFIVIYLMQIYIINSVTLFGVTGDLVLMAVVVTTLIHENSFAYITAGICGVLSDVLFYTYPCKNLIVYIIVVSVLIGLKKMYKQDSKRALIIFGVIGTVISQILEIVFNLMKNGVIVNIFSYVFLVLKASIINIFLAFIIYLVFKICSKEG